MSHPQERQFNKYLVRGADYHWKEMNPWNIIRFNAFLSARYVKIGNEIKTLLNQQTHKEIISVADFGCGDGVQLDVLRRINRGIDFQCSGIDLSDEAIAVAKVKHPTGTFFVSSVYNTPLAQNYYDFAISCDVIEHVQDAPKMIAEMVRVTKPNGFLVIGTPLKYTEIPLDSMHVKEYFLHEFSEIFSARKDIKVISHISSHSLLATLLYNVTTPLFGIRLPLIRYGMNALSLIIRKSFFLADSRHTKKLTTYQFIILQKSSVNSSRQ
jgi:ubiquinone/menaquinone biosynthesis C-methylase UbiE